MLRLFFFNIFIYFIIIKLELMLMKSKTGLLVLLILFSFFSCNKNNHEFKIEKVDNVEIAYNSNMPLYSGKSDLIKLKKILSIGKEEGDINYVLFNPSFIGIDKESNIFILDSGNYRVMKYDSLGKFIKLFGKKGSGPGEFSFPWPGCVDPVSDVIIVNDLQQYRFHFFTTLGEFKNSSKIEVRKTITQLLVNSDGNFVALERKSVSKKGAPLPFPREAKVACYSSEGKIKNSIFKHIFSYDEFENKWLRKSCIAINNDDLVYVTGIEPDIYEVNIYNQQGKLMKKVTRESKPVSYTNQEIEKFKSSAKLKKSLTKIDYPIPVMRPVVSRFTLDDNDRLWVWTGDYNIEEGWQTIDIFDKEGRYVYSFRSKELLNTTAKIFGNKLYQMEGYNEDYSRLVVYEIIDNLRTNN